MWLAIFMHGRKLSMNMPREQEIDSIAHLWSRQRAVARHDITPVDSVRNQFGWRPSNAQCCGVEPPLRLKHNCPINPVVCKIALLAKGVKELVNIN